MPQVDSSRRHIQDGISILDGPEPKPMVPPNISHRILSIRISRQIGTHHETIFEAALAAFSLTVVEGLAAREFDIFHEYYPRTAYL